MEIGPVFRALFHTKSRFWLIAIEIALTLAVVVNCVAMIQETRSEVLKPTGLDVENLLVVNSRPFGQSFEDEHYVEQSMQQDLETLRALPGVRAATPISAVPLSGGGSATGRRPQGSEIRTLSVPYYLVGSDALEALGVELEAGRDLVAEDMRDEPAGAERPGVIRNNVLLTRDLADALFPDGDALGKTIEDSNGENLDTVVGIVRRMDCSWPHGPTRGRVMLMRGVPAGPRRAIYMVRVAPGMLDELYQGTDKALAGLGQERILEVKTLAEIKAEQFEDQDALTTMLGIVSLLLIAVTSLGIVGLTSFSVTQRTRQIGTRRALGATRVAILRYFLVENWLVTGVGLTFGVAATYGLNYGLTQLLELERLDWTLVAGGVLLMWLVGLAAALLPALRSAFVPPVVATRTV